MIPGLLGGIPVVSPRLPKRLGGRRLCPFIRSFLRSVSFMTSIAQVLAAPEQRHPWHVDRGALFLNYVAVDTFLTPLSVLLTTWELSPIGFSICEHTFVLWFCA